MSLMMSRMKIASSTTRTRFGMMQLKLASVERPGYCGVDSFWL